MRPLALSLPAIPDLFQVQSSEQSSEDDIEELHTFRIPDQCHQRDADCNLCTICRPSTGACECLRGREGEGGEGGGEGEGGEGGGEGGRRGREEREGGEGGRRGREEREGGEGGKRRRGREEVEREEAGRREEKEQKSHSKFYSAHEDMGVHGI